MLRSRALVLSSLLLRVTYSISSDNLSDHAGGHPVTSPRAALQLVSDHAPMPVAQTLPSQQHPVIVLRDCKFADIQTLLAFIYQGEVQVSRGGVAGHAAGPQRTFQAAVAARPGARSAALNGRRGVDGISPAWCACLACPQTSLGAVDVAGTDGVCRRSPRALGAPTGLCGQSDP